MAGTVETEFPTPTVAEITGDQDFVVPPGKTAISLLFATGFVIMLPSADADFEPPLPEISVRLYDSNGASLGTPARIPEGLPAGLGFGLLATGVLGGVFAGFGFGLLAAGELEGMFAGFGLGLLAT
jgi:hypothetical protein